MKPLSPFRLSNTFSFSLSPELHDQLKTHTAETSPMSAILRVALMRFLDTPTEQPDLTQLFKTAPMPKRTRSIAVAIKSPQLRKQLDDYANTHNLTASAVMRRAAYEYTKSKDPTEYNPVATIDAWGDAQKT
jgi:predicted transcriptional regulator